MDTDPDAARVFTETDAVTLRELLQKELDSGNGDVFDLVRELIGKKKVAEQGLGYLTQGQRLTRTGTWAWNTSSGETFWSAEHFRVMALERAAMTPSIEGLFRMVHPEDREAVEGAFHEAVRKKTEFRANYRMVDGEGTVRHVVNDGFPVMDARGKLVEYVGTVMDVTDRRRSEDERIKLAALVEHSTDFIGLATLEGRPIFVNPAGRQMVGLANGESLKDSIVDYLVEEDEEKFRRDVVPALTRDGRWAGETRFRNFRTGAGIPMWNHVFFIRDQRGGRLALATISRDITERKRSEGALSVARAQVAQVTGMMGMAAMVASSIAHEINQPLGAIVTNCHACIRWLTARPPNLAEALGALENIARDGHRAGDIVARMRAGMAHDGRSKTPFHIDAAIAEVVNLVRSEAIVHSVAIEVDIAEGLPAVAGDPVQIQQALLNVVINAIDAMVAVKGRPRTLKIEARRDDGKGVLVSVRDSGERSGDRSGDPVAETFYTAEGTASEMGLAISSWIIEAHGGLLRGTPNADHGETFLFTLPAVAEDKP
jgi:PAS domain S-box-containing protein